MGGVVHKSIAFAQISDNLSKKENGWVNFCQGKVTDQTDNNWITLPEQYSELLISAKETSSKSSAVYGRWHILKDELDSNTRLFRCTGFYESGSYNGDTLMWINQSKLKCQIRYNNAVQRSTYCDIYYK